MKPQQTFQTGVHKVEILMFGSGVETKQFQLKKQALHIHMDVKC